MNDVTVSRACVCSFLFFLSNSFLWGGNIHAGRDAWIGVLIQTAFYSLLFFPLMYAMKNNEGRSLPELVEVYLGNVLSKIFFAVFALYGTTLTALSLVDYAEFIKANVLHSTPKWHIAVAILIVVSFLSYAGLRTVGIFSTLALPVIGVFVLLSFGFSIPKLNIDNLKPVLFEPERFTKGLTEMLAFPFGEIIIISVIYGKVRGKLKWRTWAIPFIAANLLVAAVFARNVAVIGAPLTTMLSYSTYHTDGVIGVSNVIERAEVLVSLVMLFASIIFTTLSMLFASESIARLVRLKDSRRGIPVVCVLSYAVTFFFFNTNTEISAFIDIYKYASVSMQIIVPVSIIIFSEIRKVRGKSAK